jgi:hypothetical protein
LRSHDGSSFAVESIRRWWGRVGAPAYPQADRLLITADGGSSNGYRLRLRLRLRLWKRELAELATQTGLSITVRHFSPGTSKWNRIEHRLFAGTATRTGLTVTAGLDDTIYPKGIKITDREMADLETQHLIRHDVHGDYTVSPAD